MGQIGEQNLPGLISMGKNNVNDTIYPPILHRFALCVTTFVHLICWVNFSTTQCLLLIIMDATCFDILDNFYFPPLSQRCHRFCWWWGWCIAIGGQLEGERHALFEIISSSCKVFFLSKNIVIACEWKCNNLIMYEPWCIILNGWFVATKWNRFTVQKH